jgi:site-specific DNA-methyltransferase (adenine-specific)
MNLRKYKYKSNRRVKVFRGNCIKVMEALPRHLVQCIVTSPPFFDIRSYGREAVMHWDNGHGHKYRYQLGREPYLETYLHHLTLIFKEAWRVLKPDGVLFVEIGDKYKDKQLLGVPWSMAFALRDDGWKIGAEIIWEKPNARPEGGTVRARPHRSHSTVFMFFKQDPYYFDFDAIREITGREATEEEYAAGIGSNPGADSARYEKGFRKHSRALTHPKGRSPRSVWKINTQGFKGFHFAVYPVELARRCIVAGSRKGDIILDLFCGTGRTGRAALDTGREFIGIDMVKKCCKQTWKECNE